MININRLQEYYIQEQIILSVHAQERLRQRGIRAKDIRCCVMSGEIIEQYPDDYPFPSCLIYGKAVDGRVIHVVMSDEGTLSRIITAYYPDFGKFEADLKTRKEKQI